MAVFEKKTCGRANLDDTQALTCSILAAQNVQGHMEFLLQVVRSIAIDNKWTVSRRYSDFLTLKNYLVITGVDLPLPPKKIFGNMEREFVAERQQGLQNFINIILSHPVLSQNIDVKKFFDPESYQENYNELGLQFVSMFLRSEPQWTLVEPLIDFGWRVRKAYYLLKPNADLKQRFVLSWAALGPDCYLDDKDLQSYMKSLLTLMHPCICPIKFSSAMDSGGVVIREYFSKVGSVRDCIQMSKPGTYLKKYSKSKTFTRTPMEIVKRCGRQVLDALQFLHEKGIACGNLNTGNLVVQKDICQIMDVESYVLGLPSFYRPFIVQHRKIQTMEAVDIYSFGHILYELTFGMPLLSPTCDVYPENCPDDLREILESILSPEACKNGMPALNALLDKPFFQDVNYQKSMKPKWKLPSTLKTALQKSKEFTEARLKEEQKLAKQNKRLSKIQKQLTSEDDKKRRKRLSKKMAENGTKSVENGDIISGNSSSSTPSTASATPGHKS